MRFHDIFAQHSDPRKAYTLLGSGFFRALSFGDPALFVSKWLAEHPHATYTPISTLITTDPRSRIRSEMTYIWVEDGKDALNVDLVRQGIFPGGTMYDFVDNSRGLDRLLRSDPTLAGALAQVESDRASAPEDRAERLVSESDYEVRLGSILEAERGARAEKLGIWSDSMAAYREADGLR